MQCFVRSKETTGLMIWNNSVRYCKISHKGLLDQLTSGLLYPTAKPKDSTVIHVMLFF